MYRILKYENSLKEKWNEFIRNSKNGTFLLEREYLEYHKERFQDTSFIIFNEKNKIKALIAGTIEENIYYTHKGLTYGGFILDRDSKIKDVKEYFELLNSELLNLNIEQVVYKNIPYIYYEYFSEEDEYILFNNLEARLVQLSISSTIDLTKEIKYNKSRKGCLKKAQKENLVISEDESIEEFWDILNENLRERHNATPVHTYKEIMYLKEKFPDAIKVYTVKKLEEIVAGAVIYLTKNVAHVQYISSTVLGKNISALDLLFDYLIKEKYSDKKYFDFGTSTENKGRDLNEGLIFQKEGFGARAVNYKQYEYKIKII